MSMEEETTDKQTRCSHSQGHNTYDVPYLDTMYNASSIRSNGTHFGGSLGLCPAQRMQLTCGGHQNSKSPPANLVLARLRSSQNGPVHGVAASIKRRPHRCTCLDMGTFTRKVAYPGLRTYTPKGRDPRSSLCRRGSSLGSKYCILVSIDVSGLHVKFQVGCLQSRETNGMDPKLARVVTTATKYHRYHGLGPAPPTEAEVVSVLAVQSVV
jgi:hypothetical protein